MAAADTEVQIAHPLEGFTEVKTEDYRLGSGDVVSISMDSVYKLSLKYTISEIGHIIFPTLLSPLKAQGLTLEQLRLQIIELLTEYMYNPRMMVNIEEFHSHRVLLLRSSGSMSFGRRECHCWTSSWM